MKPTTFRMVVIFLFVCIAIGVCVIAFYICKKTNPACPVPVPVSCPVVTCPTINNDRDRKVLDDPLYPPLNRMTNQPLDSFRLVGYIKSNEQQKDVGDNNWKLFGRMKNRHEVELYIVPTNNNQDIKVPLTRDVVSPKIADLYTLPDALTIKSPMLHPTPYQVIELPRSQFDPQYN